MTLSTDEYTVYQAAFCQPATSTNWIKGKTPPFHVQAAHVYEAAKSIFAERFCMTHLIGMFNAFEKECDTTRLAQITWETIYPFYDTKHWRADVFVKPWTIGGATYNSSHIKLSNDGFFYSPNTTYQTIGSPIARHNGVDFMQLDMRDEMNTKPFLPILRYGARFLKTQPLLMKTRVMHSYHEERIDVEMRDETQKRILFVTFEPGRPEEAYLTDTWQTIDFDL